MIQSNRNSNPHDVGSCIVNRQAQIALQAGSRPAPRIYAETKGGGKIVAMGGMVSLYMNSWQGVNDYQCAAFMNDVVGWLLN